jgi:hypothetical protein
MNLKHTTSLLIILLAGSGSSHSAFAAGKGNTVDLTSYWDSAVSSLLLAAGMYGVFEDSGNSGMNLTYSQSKDLFNGFASNQTSFDTQDITLSYTGSSGRLGFSAGYIYTGNEDNREAGTFLLGLDDMNGNNDSYADTTPWHLTLNLSKNFQVNDSIVMGVGSKAILTSNHLGRSEHRAFGMAFIMPISYKDYFTITPEIQWSRSLLKDKGEAANNTEPDSYMVTDEDNIYGGMSISFSY